MALSDLTISTRFHQSRRARAARSRWRPITTDGFVYQDEYVNFLDKTYPGAFAATNNPIMINLDNEPDLWQSTHARLRGDGTVGSQAGTTATYAEMVQRTVDYADAAKDVNPAAQIFGPVNYGWQGMIRFQDAADAAGRDFLNFYLQQMAAAETTDRASTGRRARRALVSGGARRLRRQPMDGCASPTTTTRRRSSPRA